MDLQGPPGLLVNPLLLRSSPVAYLKENNICEQNFQPLPITSPMSSPTPLPLGELAKLQRSPLPPKSTPGFWLLNPIFLFMNDTYAGFSEHRRSIGLGNPGTLENLDMKVTRDVLVDAHFFSGLKADISKIFNTNPVFQLGHLLLVGSKLFPPYSFNAVVGGDELFAQGMIDNERNISGRFFYSWSKDVVSKLQLQLLPLQPLVAVFEQDVQGHDHSLNFKLINPYYDGDFSGIFKGLILQAVSLKLAIGFEAGYQKMHGDAADAQMLYFARYAGKDWTATGQIGGDMGISATMYRKVSDNLEAALLTLIQPTFEPIIDPILQQPIGINSKMNASTLFGTKYQFRQSVVRSQISTQGTVSMYLEQRILQPLTVLVSAEIDHWKNTSKVGVGLQFEIPGSEEVMAQTYMVDAQGNPVQAAA